MSNRGRPSQPRLPLRVALVLVICAGSLAAHFIGEGLAPADGQIAFELAAQGVHMHPAYEHCEDDFLFSSPGYLHVEHFLTQPVSQAVVRSSSVLISPPLPPPNF